MSNDRVVDLHGLEALIAQKPTIREVVAVEVIRVTYYQGLGTPDDPGREVCSYYTKAGQLIGDHDPYNAPTLDQIDAGAKATNKKRTTKARGKKKAKQ